MFIGCSLHAEHRDCLNFHRNSSGLVVSSCMLYGETEAQRGCVSQLVNVPSGISDLGVASSMRSDGGVFLFKDSYSQLCAESLSRMSFKPLSLLVFRALQSYTYLAVDEFSVH